MAETQTERGNAGSPSWGLPGRIVELDGLRGFAVLLVLISHYLCFQVSTETARWAAPALSVLGFAWSGVDLFFVLSGFLIGGILLDHRDSPTYFKTFYLRRFWRIVPIYGVVCLAFWVAGWFLDWLNVARPVWLFHKPMPWYSYATFSQNFAMAREGGYFGANWLGVTWSLAIEEQFYLLAPITIRWIPRDRLPWVLGGVILAGIFLRELSESILLYVFPHGRLTAYVMMPCRADSLAVGILAAWMVRSESLLEWLRARRATLLLTIGIGTAGFLVFIARGWGLFSRPMSLFGFSWLAMFYGCLLLYARLFPVSVLGSLLRFRPLVQLGTISYCVYLIHQPVSGLFHWLLRGGEPMIQKPSDAVVTLLALVVTLTVAKISWDHFEKPLVKLGHRRSY